MTNIYVGNLPYTATEDELRDLFAAHGEVSRVQLMTDRETGRARGFGFVEMATGGPEAIEALNQYSFKGRPLQVNEARPRGEGGPRREGGGGGYGGPRPGGGGGYQGGGPRRDDFDGDRPRGPRGTGKPDAFRYRDFDGGEDE